MKNFILLYAILTLISCSRNPLTKRRSLTLIPNSQVLSMSNTEYSTFLNKNKISTDAANTQLVKTVGARIATAVEAYLRSQKLGSDLKEYKWEFNLVESSEVNAWCMPGGKVVFYTGILPFTQDESGLAAVMGHEIAHAVAKHGNERMSQQLAVQLGATALSVALTNQNPLARNVYMTAYGLGSQVGVLLPFSRTQESEADYMGLIFMAMAGYQPSTAVNFWERMAAKSKGSPPEFLSTHPSDKRRIKNLQKQMKEAEKYFKQF